MVRADPQEPTRPNGGTVTARTLLDVRGPDEFADGHLEGALNIPVQELEARLAELGSRERPVAVYCRSGRRSGLAAEILRAAGFAIVIDLGGIG